MSKNTAAIVCQSTYGLSPDLDEIMDMARQFGVPVIDDCTHGLGGYYKGTPNGFVTDAAFFSTQWSKPISAGLGGIAVVRNSELSENVKAEHAACSKPSLLDDCILAAQRTVRPIADIPMFHYSAVKAYRWVTQSAGLKVGSSSADEITGITRPNGYNKRCAPMQRKAIKKQIKKLEKKIQERHQNVERYNEYFSGMDNIQVPITPDYAVHGMLRYTIQVDNAAEVLRRAKINNIPVGDWFDTPIYPVYENLDKWFYVAGSCPVAERVCKRVINLPTDKPLSVKDMDVLFMHYSSDLVTV